jgi:hypothetical protein
MDEPVTCLDCRMADPPPEMTCHGGTPGGFLRDHFVGDDKGCPGCGRLTAACVLRPCSVWRESAAAEEARAEGEAEAWGGRGVPGSYDEWLNDEKGAAAEGEADG